MRRRICLGLTTVGLAFLMVPAVLTSAASAAASGIGKPSVLRCTATPTVVPPAGSGSVEQPPPGGQMFGGASCPKFGGGVMAASFTVLDNGNWVGKYTDYLGTGSISGTINLVPQEGGPVSTNFEAQDWAGVVTVNRGTGAYKGIKGLKGKKNLGTITCSSPDTVHLVCTEKIKVTG